MESGWPEVPLAECCEIVSGATPSRNVRAYWGGSILWATPRDLSGLQDVVLTDTAEKITEAGYSSCSAMLMPKGSILFSSRAPIGLVAIAGAEMCTNQGFKSLVPGPAVDSRYLYWCMKRMAPRIADMGTGATFKEVSKAAMARVLIPLPPLGQQKRIAAVLDEADAIRSKRQKATALTEALLRSIFLKMFGDPGVNPQGWPVVHLEEIASKITDGEHLTPRRALQGTLLLSARNVKNGFIDLDAGVDYVPQEEFERIQKRCNPEKDDIVMSCSGTIGRVARVPGTYQFGLVRSVALIKPNHERVRSVYLEHYLRSDWSQAQIQRAANKSAQANIFIGPIKNLRVVQPPIEHQEIFDEVAADVAVLSLKLESAARTSESLFGSLSQRAFRGEL